MDFMWNIDKMIQNWLDEPIDPVTIDINNNTLKIRIIEKLDYLKFKNIITEKIDEKYLKILSSFIIKKETQLEIQDIIFYNTDDFKILYCIVRSKDLIIIFKKEITDDLIREVIFKIRIGQQEFLLNQIEYNLNKKVEKQRIYTSKDLDSSNKVPTIFSIRTLLNTMIQTPILNEKFNVLPIYSYFDLISPKQYNPLISDGIISLSIKEKDINIYEGAFLDIILNETLEKVGDINFVNNNKFSYDGNIGYEIKRKYQNKGYATRALNLLKQLLANRLTSERNFYIAIKPENEYSIRVAEKNKAELIYEGAVPESEIIYSLDNVTEVKVYKITI